MASPRFQQDLCPWQGPADRGDEFLSVNRLVAALAEARGEQPVALDLGESGERNGGREVLDAAGLLERADAAQGLETVLARHREVDEQHVGRIAGGRALERGDERGAGAEALRARA